MREHNAHNHDHLPPPVGVRREHPLSTNEAMKQLIEKDPDYARWVLFRSEQLIGRLEEWQRSGTDPRQTDLKEDIVEILLEARELVEAIQTNRNLARLFQASPEV